MTVAEDGCKPLSEAYQTTLEYFAKQYSTPLSAWAVSIECAPSQGRIRLIEAPMGSVELKVSLSWKRIIPPCLHSSEYYAKNRQVYRKLLSDIDAYGYSLSDLALLEEEPGVVSEFLSRFKKGRSLRVKDVLNVLHYIRLSSKERARRKEIQAEGLGAMRMWQHQQNEEESRRRRLGEQALLAR